MTVQNATVVARRVTTVRPRRITPGGVAGGVAASSVLAAARVRTVPRGPVSENATGPGYRPVLLVDPSPLRVSWFKGTFGADLCFARSVDELQSLVDRGWSWGTAFVGNDLGAGKPTGLSAMGLLRSTNAARYLVACGAGRESGNAVFAAAARRWFGVNAFVDCDSIFADQLGGLIDVIQAGGDATSAPWQSRLEYAFLLDRVIAQPSWLQIWRTLCLSAGDMQLTGTMLGVPATHLRSFKDRATDAVNEFRDHLEGIPLPQNSRNKKGVLSAFAAENRTIFLAPGLAQAMYRPSAARVAVG